MTSPVRRTGPNIVDDARGAAQALARGHNEDALGMLGGKVSSAARRPRLEEQRRALGRGLSQMRPGDVIVLADVMDWVDLGRVRVNAARGVAQHRVVLPTALPQLIGHLEVLIRTVVALVVGGEPAVPEARPGVREIRRHDVPRDAPTRQMVERRYLASE